MKLVFYSVSTTSYGAPTSLLNLIQGFSKEHKEIKIYVVVPSIGLLTKELYKLPVTVIVLPFYKWIYKTSIYKTKKRSSILLAFLWFYKNMLQKLFLNIVYLPVHIFKVRKINPDMIYVNASGSPMGILVAKILNIKSVWHHREPVNDPDTDFFLEWNERISKKILGWPDIRIYNSQFLQGMYQAFMPYNGRSYIVYNGVPNSFPWVKMDRREIVFGMVGKIEPGLRKGQAEVIECFKKLTYNDIQLNIYGDGEASYIRLLKQKSNGNRIFFKGFKTIRDIYPEIDFLIMNSRNESFGRVVAEAYSYGVPVLALRSGALPEIVDDGETGFIYEDQQQLLTLIEMARVLRKKPEYAKMQDYCIQKFNDNFTIGIYSQNILAILSKPQ